MVCSAPDQDIDRVPQCAAFLALGRRQPIHRFVVQQPVQLGIGPQMRQLLGNQNAICVRTAVQHAGPEGDFGPEPLAGPLAPPRPLRFAEPGAVAAATAANQRGGAGGPIAVVGVEVPGQSR